MLPGAEFNGRGPTVGETTRQPQSRTKKELLIMSRMGTRGREEGRGGGWGLEVTRSRSVTVDGRDGGWRAHRICRPGRRRVHFSFVSRRNKGISDDKCQARTRSTGSARAREQGASRHGDKRGCWKPWESPPPHKEPPAWKIMLATTT